MMHCPSNRINAPIFPLMDMYKRRPTVRTQAMFSYFGEYFDSKCNHRLFLCHSEIFKPRSSTGISQAHSVRPLVALQTVVMAQI